MAALICAAARASARSVTKRQQAPPLLSIATALLVEIVNAPAGGLTLLGQFVDSPIGDRQLLARRTATAALFA